VENQPRCPILFDKAAMSSSLDPGLSSTYDSPDHRLPFVRAAVSRTVVATICTACGKLVGCSNNPQMLILAENAHRCSYTP
jgi:hypothetical protein